MYKIILFITFSSCILELIEWQARFGVKFFVKLVQQRIFLQIIDIETFQILKRTIQVYLHSRQA